jgi:hypothetical protein
MGVFRGAVISLTLGFALGIISLAKAGPQSQLGNQGGYNTEPVVSSPNSPNSNPSSEGLVMPGNTSSGANGAASSNSAANASESANSGSSSASNNSNNNNSGYTGTDDEDDPTLYRTKTKDGLAVGSMSRDDGQLTAKPHRREKISVVDSTKKLPTSGTDPKFQGSLLHSSVTSIDDISAKPDEASDADQQDAQQDEVDPRFTKRRLVFKPQTTAADSRKKESERAKADSSPSPTATPTPVSPSSPNR